MNTMHISKVTIENIRSFERITLDFAERAGNSRFAVIVGDNGVGKTTLLRCIAIGLCDVSDAAGLLSELWGDVLRNPKEPARIQIILTSGNTNYSLTKTIAVSNGRNYEVSQEEENFPWQRLFVCGYGAQRGVYGTKEYNEYALVDAVYSLFNYETVLQSAELVLRRRAGFNKDSAKKVCSWLARLLLLPVGSITLKSTGLFVSGRGCKPRPIMASADGYQATITWIMDLLGWASLDGRDKNHEAFSGIVLVDELEQHLHPEWQRHIVRLLHAQFPRLQFVTTTHSPLCAAGVADLPDSRAYLGLLKLQNNEVSSIELAPLRGLRYDQILTSEAFGLPIARNDTTEKLIKQLRAAPRGSAAHETTLKVLRKYSISAAEDEEDRKLRQKVAADLEQLRKLAEEKGQK
jgi:hypothetical protein